MGRSAKKQARIEQQIAELDLARHNGLMRCIASIVCFTVLIIVKLSLTTAGVEWANTVWANGALFVLALVAAGFAGIGSRDWRRAKTEMEGLEQKRR